MTPVLLPHLDLDDLRTLLLRVEADVHRRSWNAIGPGLHIYCLYDNADVVTAGRLRTTMQGMGPVTRVGRYSAQVMLPARIFDRLADQGQAYEHLRNFAVNVAFADDGDIPVESSVPPGGLDQIRGLLRMPGILGYAACYEGWARYAPGPMPPIDAGTRIADEPGARETRIVLAVDALDRVHRVQRMRGDKPEADMCVSMRGDLSTSLRIMVDTTYRRLPEPTAEAFAARYPTLNQVNGHDVGGDGGRE